MQLPLALAAANRKIMIALGTAVFGIFGVLPWDGAMVNCHDTPLFIGADLRPEEWILTIQFYAHWRIWLPLWAGVQIILVSWNLLGVDDWVPRLVLWTRGN